MRIGLCYTIVWYNTSKTHAISNSLHAIHSRDGCNTDLEFELIMIEPGKDYTLDNMVDKLKSCDALIVHERDKESRNLRFYKGAVFYWESKKDVEEIYKELVNKS